MGNKVWKFDGNGIDSSEIFYSSLPEYHEKDAQMTSVYVTQIPLWWIDPVNGWVVVRSSGESNNSTIC